MANSWDDDLALALAMADRADAISMQRFRAADLVVEAKADMTPVSDADRAVETAIRDILAGARPSDSLVGEEFGVAGEAARRWIVDPIDGTKNFVRGSPVWASLIALALYDPAPARAQTKPADPALVLGVVSAPALGMRWWATRGGGAWSGSEPASARRLRVSNVAKVGDSSVSYSDWNDPAWKATRTQQGFQRLLSLAWRSRAYGDFWSHMLVAEGAVDVAVEPALSIWDMAALVPIVEEAGGHITAIDGSGALSGGSALSTNTRLHAAVLSLLQPSAATG